jgi:hypothetical protein
LEKNIVERRRFYSVPDCTVKDVITAVYHESFMQSASEAGTINLDSEEEE